MSSARYTDNGSVCVLPGKLPANVIVAPNSPNARAHDNTAPAISAERIAGNVTRRNEYQVLAPSVRAASSWPMSACRKRRLDRDDEERHGDKRLGDHDAERCERQTYVEPTIEPLADQTTAAEREQQRDAADYRWQHHRQRAQRTHDRPADEPTSCQQPCQRKTEHDGERRRAHTAHDRQLQRLANVGASQDRADVTPRGPADEPHQWQRKEDDGEQREHECRPWQRPVDSPRCSSGHRARTT